MRLPSTAESPADGEVEVAHGRGRDPAGIGRRHDGERQRVFTRPLDAGREAENLTIFKARRGDDPRHGRFAFSQRAGLVDDERVDLLHSLKRLGVLDQHASSAAPDTDHDRHRLARPSAQGQAMMRTDTAATSP